MKEEGEHPRELSAPRPGWALVAVSVLSIGIFLWCGGFFVGVGIRQQNGVGLGAMIACGLMGPGGLAILQFLGTFGARRIGAITCTLFYSFVAIASFIVGCFVVTDVAHVRLTWLESLWRGGLFCAICFWSWSSLGLNLARSQQLLRAPAARAIPLRFTTREFFLFMLAIGIVLGGASFAAHR
ncbi:hypothetical protein [Blastopirellula marina]|uniref:Uncharacterized protein n=1 Tax=Blastopirellula marina TaxID=124 RepID=A0A2S8GLM1_9BACT|nr:hypothetical protein [Blastopirellula marina]PQO45221.1 hypothetical protein C5Y93_14760 [Blastopirellula marina]